MAAQTPEKKGLIARNVTWPKVLQALTIVVFVLVLLYEFLRPTAKDYQRINGDTFSKNWGTNPWNATIHLVWAIPDHLGSLSPSALFSILLLSLAFALVYYLFKDIGPLLAKRDLAGFSKETGYFRLATMSLLATLVTLSSFLPLAGGINLFYYSAAIVAVAGSLILMLVAWEKWSRF
jgi:hypothetical protein